MFSFVNNSNRLNLLFLASFSVVNVDFFHAETELA